MSAVCLWCMVAGLFSLSMQACSQPHSLPWLPDKTWALSRRLVPGPRQGSPNDCNKKKKKKSEKRNKCKWLPRGVPFSCGICRSASGCRGWIAAIVCGHGASGKINTDRAHAVQQQRNNNNTIICYSCRGERAPLSTNDGLALGSQVRRSDAHAQRDVHEAVLALPVRHTRRVEGELRVNSRFDNRYYSETNWWIQDSEIFVVLCTQQQSHFKQQQWKQQLFPLVSLHPNSCSVNHWRHLCVCVSLSAKTNLMWDIAGFFSFSFWLCLFLLPPCDFCFLEVELFVVVSFNG